MTRKIAAYLLLATLALAGCKKSRVPDAGQARNDVVPAAATAAGDGGPAAGAAPGAVAEPPPPSRPDLLPATAATPAPAVNPAVDTSANVMVLCYHNIDNSGSKALTITIAEFEKELQEIKNAGFSVIPMQDFLAWRRGEKSIPHKSCVITLDDGWLSAYTNAWPLLKKYGFPFTLFIYIEYVGSGGKSMTWDQLAEMRDAGVDIECHTWTHSNLHGKGNKPKVMAETKAMGYEPWLRHEIIDSKKELETRLGIKVNCLAYPYGVWNSAVRAVVKEAGYEAAFTVYGQRVGMHSPPSDLIGRYAVEATKPKIFADALSMTGGGVAASEAPSAAAVGQLAATSMITKPMNGETVNTTKPTIGANLASMGEVEPGSVRVRLSGVGPLTVQYSAETKAMTAQLVQALKPGEYTVIVSAKAKGQNVETRWQFKVSPTATAPGAAPGGTPIPPSAPTL